MGQKPSTKSDSKLPKQDEKENLNPSLAEAEKGIMSDARKDDQNRIFIFNANLRNITPRPSTLGKFKLTDVEAIESIERVGLKETAASLGMYTSTVVNEIKEYVKSEELRLEKLKEKLKEQQLFIEEAEEEEEEKDDDDDGEVIEGDEKEKERIKFVKGFEREIKHRWIIDVIGLMENHTIEEVSEKFGGVERDLMKIPVIGYKKFLRSLKKQVEEEEETKINYYSQLNY